MIANYVHTRFDTDVNTNIVGKDFDDEDAFTMRAQLDF